MDSGRHHRTRDIVDAVATSRSDVPARLLVLDDVVVGVRPLFVTKTVAAELLGCSESLVNGYIRLRYLPAHYHGTKPVISLQDLENFAARLPTEPRSLGL